MQQNLQLRGNDPLIVGGGVRRGRWVDAEILSSRTLTNTVEPFYCTWRSRETIRIPQAIEQITRATYRLATLDEVLDFRESGGLRNLRHSCKGLLILNKAGSHLAAMHRDGTISGWNEDPEHGIHPWHWAVATIRERC